MLNSKADWKSGHANKPTWEVQENSYFWNINLSVLSTLQYKYNIYKYYTSTIIKTKANKN
jgi:hypothetical protein